MKKFTLEQILVSTVLLFVGAVGVWCFAGPANDALYVVLHSRAWSAVGLCGILILTEVITKG